MVSEVDSWCLDVLAAAAASPGLPLLAGCPSSCHLDSERMSGRSPVVSVLDPARVARVQIAHEEYHATDSDAYDEALLEVSERVEERGSVGKADIGALVLWKRMRADTKWARSLSLMTDAAVRQITGEAVTAVRDARLATPEAAGRGRAALGKLPGFARGDALASALLVAAAPNRMAVYDRRAQAGLEMLGGHVPPRGATVGRRVRRRGGRFEL